MRDLCLINQLKKNDLRRKHDLWSSQKLKRFRQEKKKTSINSWLDRRHTTNRLFFLWSLLILITAHLTLKLNSRRFAVTSFVKSNTFQKTNRATMKRRVKLQGGSRANHAISSCAISRDSQVFSLCKTWHILFLNAWCRISLGINKHSVIISLECRRKNWERASLFVLAFNKIIPDKSGASERGALIFLGG